MKIRSVAFNTALKNELAERKRSTEHLRRQRLNEVYQKIPEIKSLDENLRALAFDLGRHVMHSPADGSGAAARNMIDHKLAERAELLIKNGYPVDYTDEQFVCMRCRDTGRINGELCQCVSQLAIKTAFEDSGINYEQNFDNFDLSLQTTPRNFNAMKKICETAYTYAESFPLNERQDMLYYGPPGVGKTYLLNCIGGIVLKKGYSVLKINANRLIQITLDNLRTAPEDRPDFTMPDLLIIDDLGTEPMIPNITVETLLSILCERQDGNKATLFATNLDVVSSSDSGDSIQDFYGERFASRLMAPRRVKIQKIGTDNVRITSNQ